MNNFHRRAFTASFIAIGLTVSCRKVVAANQLQRILPAASYTACCIQSH